MRRTFFLAALLLPALIVNTAFAQVVKLDSLRRAAAAESGGPAAMLLAEGFSFGRWGLKANRDSANAYVARAAKLGVAEAQYLRGAGLVRGLDGKRDLKTGLVLLEKAANQQHILALQLLTQLYADTSRSVFTDPGTVVKVDFAKAYGYARRGAELGDARSAMHAGWAAFNGKGIPQNDSLAIYWWTLAAEKGNVNAQLALADLYYYGTARTARNLPQARVYYQMAASHPTALIEEQTLGRIGLHNLDQLPRRLHNLNLLGVFAVPYGMFEVKFQR